MLMICVMHPVLSSTCDKDHFGLPHHRTVCSVVVYPPLPPPPFEDTFRVATPDLRALLARARVSFADQNLLHIRRSRNIALAMLGALAPQYPPLSGPSGPSKK